MVSVPALLDRLSPSVLTTFKSARLRRLLLVTPFAWIALSTPASAQIQLCPWNAQGDLPPRGNRNEVVEWGSLADGAKDILQLTTFVVNRDTHPRMIDWNVGGIHVGSLEPGHFAFTCSSSPVVGRVDRIGPLYFERDSTSISTTVYDGPTPREKDVKTGARLTLTSQAVIHDADKKPTLSVKVTTELSATQNGYQVTYIIDNLNDKDVDVEFAIDPNVAQQLGGQVRRLKAKDFTKVVVSSPTYPYFVRYPMALSDPAAQTVTGVFDVPTMKPTSHKAIAK
jgi:hypothetical protein